MHTEVLSEVLTEGHSLLVDYENWILLHKSGMQGGLGIKLKPDQDADLLEDAINDALLIAIETAAHTDGRMYSLARELRSRLNFKNELRAIGVLPDNIEMLAECGFDTFVVEDTADMDGGNFNAFPDLFGIPSVYPPRAV